MSSDFFLPDPFIDFFETDDYINEQEIIHGRKVKKFE